MKFLTFIKKFSKKKGQVELILRNIDIRVDDYLNWSLRGGGGELKVNLINQ